MRKSGTGFEERDIVVTNRHWPDLEPHFDGNNQDFSFLEQETIVAFLEVIHWNFSFLDQETTAIRLYDALMYPHSSRVPLQEPPFDHTLSPQRVTRSQPIQVSSCEKHVLKRASLFPVLTLDTANVSTPTTQKNYVFPHNFSRTLCTAALRKQILPEP